MNEKSISQLLEEARAEEDASGYASEIRSIAFVILHQVVEEIDPLTTAVYPLW